MPATREIEGTWEEILADASNFSGKRVRLTLLEQEPERETDLLKKINIGIAPELWSEYHALIAKRQTETISEPERARLIEIGDTLEAANVSRIEALIELAKLRNLPLDKLMQELGISNREPV